MANMAKQQANSHVNCISIMDTYYAHFSGFTVGTRKFDHNKGQEESYKDRTVSSRKRENKE